MMSVHREKREMQIILMLAVVSMAVYALFFGIRLLQTESADKSAYEEQIHLVEEPQIIQVNDGGEPYSLTKSGTDWICDIDDELKISRIKITFMKTALREMEVQRVIPDGQQYFRVFGLDDPSTVVIVSTSEGQKKYCFGDYNAALDEYYLTVDDSDCVYLISASDAKLIRKSLLEIIADPEITSEFTDDVEAIEIESEETRLSIRRAEEGFTVQTQEKSFSCSEYKVMNICSALSSASYQCRYHNASAADKAFCGLDNPAFSFRFKRGDGKTLKLQIGKGDDDRYYLNENDSKIIYQVGDSSIERLSERILPDSLE